MEHLWHEHYLPAFFAALIVAIIAAFFELTTSSVVLFASIGASAFILTNSHSHHLTKLHTTVKAYIISIILSVAMYYVKLWLHLSTTVSIFLLIFFICSGLYLFNAVHPPAVSASLTFLLLETTFLSLVYLFIYFNNISFNLCKICNIFIINRIINERFLS